MDGGGLACWQGAVGRGAVICQTEIKKQRGESAERVGYLFEGSVWGWWVQWGEEHKGHKDFLTQKKHCVS